MKMQWDVTLTTMLVMCALGTTGLVVRHEFFAPRPQGSPQKPMFVPDWRSQVGKHVLFGSPNAPVQLVEFADFECPFCGTFHKTLQAVRKHYPSKVALTYIHFLIPGHRFAMPAARVAECAGEQGRFEAMYDRLFEGQDSFGLKPWSEYAAAAGVPDLGQFDACIKRSGPILQVEEGKQLGTQINVQGTPTLVINGWKLGHPPSEQELDAMVKAVLAGREPVSGAGKS